MNKNFEIQNDEAIIKISKNIYEKKILLQTAYIKLEKYYILIDDDEKNYIISIKYKDEKENTKEKLKKAVYEFFDELIETASYIEQLKNTEKIRTTLLESALLPNQENTSFNIKEEEEN